MMRDHLSWPGSQNAEQTLTTLPLPTLFPNSHIKNLKAIHGQLFHFKNTYQQLPTNDICLKPFIGQRQPTQQSTRCSHKLQPGPDQHRK